MRPTCERRRHRRLELTVPVLFTVKTRTGTGVTRSGVTRDVSPGGVFFCTDAAHDLEPQRELTIKLLIPRQSEPGDATVSLSGEARIVRTERVSDSGRLADGLEQWAIAAQFTSRPSVDLTAISSLFGHA
jgi:hypothetical protein